MFTLNIGDYFLNNDHYLCKIVDSYQDFNGKLVFHVHIIDTDHHPIVYANELKHYVFKHLGNNEEVVRTLYSNKAKEVYDEQIDSIIKSIWEFK